MANLRDSKGKELHADYLYKKSLGKKNKQPNGGTETKGAEAKGKK